MSFSGPDSAWRLSSKSTTAVSQDASQREGGGVPLARAPLHRDAASAVPASSSALASASGRHHYPPHPPVSARGRSRLSHVASQPQRPRPSQQRKPPEPLRRAVADCLSASHHSTSSALTSEAVRTLQDYLSNPSTIDIGYKVLLEHALAERDRSPPVVAKCVLLLKRYLFRYIPTKETLEQIDSFCLNLISECNSITNKQVSSRLQSSNSQPGSNVSVSSTSATTSTAFASDALVKSLNYVRALVAKHIPRHSYQPVALPVNSKASSKKFYPSLSSSRTRSFGSSVTSSGIVSRASPEHKESATSAIMDILGLEPIVEDNVNYIALNVLKLRWTVGMQQQSWTPSPVMTESGGIALPQIDRKFEFLEMGVAALLIDGLEQKGFLERRYEHSLSSDVYSEKLLHPSTVTTVADAVTAQSHLRAIAALKRVKAGSSQVWEDVPVSTWRFRSRPLFQYRYYSEQQPLKLSPNEVEEVIAAVCTVGPVTNTTIVSRLSLLSSRTGRPQVDTSDIAASVLIKLVIDMYMEDYHIASPLAFSMLEGMLRSPQLTARTRAFDLILNLGVHAHLLETMRRDSQSTQLGESSAQRSDNSNKSLNSSNMNASHSGKGENGTPHAVSDFEIWLLKILCESLLFLVQIEERHESVWASALSCLMYMICDRGRIQCSRLKGLDIRVIKVLLEVSRENSWAEELHCRLICLLSNMLYHSSEALMISSCQLDIGKLELLGGIGFICEEYARANMTEEKNNLFAVLFDYVLLEMKNKWLTNGNPFPSYDEIQAVATVLVLAGAPEAFSIALKIGLKDVGDVLWKSIIRSISRDVTSGRLNSEALGEILYMLDSVVSAHSCLGDEFSEMFKLTLSSEYDYQNINILELIRGSDMVSRAWGTLSFLLHSPRAIYRQNGYSWLVELLVSEMKMESNRLNIQKLQQQFRLLGLAERSTAEHMEEQSSQLSPGVQILIGLLKSEYNYVRCGFIIVLERVILHCQWCQLRGPTDQEMGDELVDEFSEIGNRYSVENAYAIIALMNGALSQIFLANETDRINILKMCDLLYSQLCVRISPSVQAFVYPNTAMRDAMAFYSSHSSSDGKENMERHYIDEASSTRFAFISGVYPSKSTSKAALLLRGNAAAPRQLVTSVPTSLLFWPLIQLAGAATDNMSLGIAVGSKGRGNIPGGASDIRAALLLLLIGKCATDPTAFQEVGGEEFFRSLLDDTDARVAYYTSAFLLKRMMSEEPEKYKRMLYNLLSKAQQCNNEKLLENPYLQMRGIIHLSSDLGSQLSFHES